MDWLIIEGVKPYDGRYEFDTVADFTTREWGFIKRLAGYLPLGIEKGFEGGDPELFAVFAVIVLHRAGKVETKDVGELYERILDAPFGSTIRLETEAEAGDDAGPPAPSSSGNDSSSGTGSPASSETWEAPRNGSGTPVSDISPSNPATSVT